MKPTCLLPHAEPVKAPDLGADKELEQTAKEEMNSFANSLSLTQINPHL